MDITTIDIPSTVTAILTIIVAVGGVLGKTYIGKALAGVAQTRFGHAPAGPVSAGIRRRVAAPGGIAVD